MEAEVEQVIEIHPNAKYILVIDIRTPRVEQDRLRTRLDEWWKSDSPFLVVSNALTFKRVDEITDKE